MSGCRSSLTTLMCREHLQSKTFSANVNDIDEIGFNDCRCYHEYLDLFTELKKNQVGQLIETPFGGRYCGKIPPRLKISLYNALTFVFHSDRDNITETRFSGSFTFIPDGEWTRDRTITMIAHI